MNALEFLIKLKGIAPAKADLLRCGYGDEEADEFIDSFECQRRSPPLGIETNGDPMLDLLDAWDISCVEIGPIRFHTEPKNFDGHLEIGTVEGDRLMYRSGSGDYVLLDSQDLSYVMCDAASNGIALLDGLFHIAEYLSKTAIDEIDIDDVVSGIEAKNKCMELFGGGKYEMFCTTVLGV